MEEKVRYLNGSSSIVSRDIFGNYFGFSFWQYPQINASLGSSLFFYSTKINIALNKTYWEILWKLTGTFLWLSSFLEALKSNFSDKQLATFPSKYLSKLQFWDLNLHCKV